MILRPTVNINRVPLWGRNFEGYGEDPYLASRLGVEGGFASGGCALVDGDSGLFAGVV